MCTVEGQINFNQFETHFGITFVGWNFPFHPIKPEFSLYMGVDKDLLTLSLVYMPTSPGPMVHARGTH